MGQEKHGTAIGWTQAPGFRGETWNATTGCSHVSAGCDICYAEALSLRRGWSEKPWTPENAEENVVLHPERLTAPYRWREPRAIFTNSMSDLFHPLVPYQFIADVWRAMHDNPRHRFMTLTKRPKRMRDWTRTFAARAGISESEVWPSWMWIGTSVEDRDVVGRADLLRETSAAVRFVSAEPLLGAIIPGLDLSGISWLIVGGESGSGHRKMHLQWLEDLVAEADRLGVATFVKQDSGPRPDQQGRIPDDLLVREWPALSAKAPDGALF
jgi:protein gp37